MNLYIFVKTHGRCIMYMTLELHIIIIINIIYVVYVNKVCDTVKHLHMIWR